ncbi:MAG TPA: sigma-70 family RNA polymerase sigma factor, partial [Gemmataceae bacterium]|nr:sigma-70 family RNA polymerase sigma factor [Gemmataceae bacterium]
ALVRRHGAMVLAAARRVLGNAHDSEDVCQAAFLLLAKKAGSGRWGPSVAPWLHRTAHLMALKARRTAARRARSEGRAARPEPTNPLAEMTGQELLAVLDAELLALPESLRAPLVLCYLQGATRDEAAERLGCPLSTLKKRLERGRDRLHAALARRGLGLSAVLLGTLLIRQSMHAVPATLVGQTTQAALAVTSGRIPAGLISAPVIRLVNGGIGMSANKLKTVIGVLLVGGLLSVAVVSATGAGDDKAPQTPPKEVAKAPDPKPEEPTVAREEMRVTVLDPDGKPLAGANVHSGIWTNEPGFKANQDVRTDEAGVARMKLPKSYYIVRLWAGKKPFAGVWAGWEQAELSRGKGVPAEYTFRLGKTTTAGGRVVDEKGKPVRGARVQVDLTNSLSPPGGDGRVRLNGTLAYGSDAATTDADGRWRIDNVPDHPEVELSLLVTHPDFVADHWLRPAKDEGITPAMLRDGTATVKLKTGVIVRGRVTEPDGKPVKDAVVIHGDDPYGGRTTSKFPTDADGRYRLPALPPGTTALTVLARGWAPQMRRVDLRDGIGPQDFRMAPGKPARLRIVDAAGKPVPKASVYLKEWKGGSRSIYSDHDPNHPKIPDTGIPRKSDADGVWEWPAAPDEPVKVEVYGRGTASVQLEVTGGTDQTVTLKAEHRITGTVTDAVTGKPIRAFTVIPVDVFHKTFLNTERGHAVAGKEGKLDFLADRADIPLRVRIEAVGYRTQDGPEFRVGDDAARRQDFRLQPSLPRTGVVLGPDGKPAAKAAVYLATPTEVFDPSSDIGPHRVFTDATGQFQFPDPGEPWAVFARADSGAASAEFPADRADAGTLRLQPWASVRGTFADGGKPVAGANVFVHRVRLDNRSGPRAQDMLEATTGPDGRFEFPRVAPGPVTVAVGLGPWRDEGFRSGPIVPLDLKPGERGDLTLGSGGATLTGKVKMTGKVPADLDCTYSLNYLVRRDPGIAPPAEVAKLGFDVHKGWSDRWEQTAEGRAYLSTLRRWFVKLTPDGSFRVSGVQPGEYDLAVAAYAKPSGCLIDPLARCVVRVTVSEADAKRGELAVPGIAAEVVPVPTVGDTPAVSFTKTDGTAGTLADYRDKYVVVHFWASWCGPCKEQLPAVRKLHKRFSDRGIAVVGLALDDDATAWQSAVKDLGLPWPQGRLKSGGTPGVSSVPAYWLLDPDEIAKVLGDRLK